MYRKEMAAGVLLWNGIGRFARRYPEAATVFGAASISRQHQAASRGLMAQTDIVKRLAGTAATIEHISLSISDIEEDGKGVPVLIRQYLKIGGKVTSFNVDPLRSMCGCSQIHNRLR